MSAARAVSVALAIASLSGCGGQEATPRAASEEHARPTRSASTHALESPPRYLVSSETGWVDRTPSGLDHFVANGVRLETQGAIVTRVGDAVPALDGGFAAPNGAAEGDSPKALGYVFWKNRTVFFANEFFDAPRIVAELPAEVIDAFAWVGGVGITTREALYVLDLAKGTIAPIAAPLATRAVAAGPRLGVATTALGRTLMTNDGSVFRDLTSALGRVRAIEARGGEIAITLDDGRERFLDESGALRLARTTSGAAAGDPPPTPIDRWPKSGPVSLLEAVEEGLPLGPDRAIAATAGAFGVVDLASGRTLSSALLDETLGDCAPFQAKDALLLVCVSFDRATVIDVTTTPRIERTFDLTTAPYADRFVGTDSVALGFLGPCEGSGPRPVPIDTIASASPISGSTQRSATLCVRASRDRWIEHRLDPADASFVFGWAARGDGGAVALIVRPGHAIDDSERASEQGLLRVLRVAGGEPPLSVPRYGGLREPVTIARELSASNSGDLEAWLPSENPSSGLVSAQIDRRGRVRVRLGPSRATGIVTSGPFALSPTDDGRLFETIDRGATWIDVDPPPGEPLALPSSCSPVGCSIGLFLRVGWATPSGALAKALTESEQKALERAQSDRFGVQRRAVVRPLVRLGCRFTEPAAGSRLAGTFGFGVVPGATARVGSPARLGTLGVLSLPSKSRGAPQSGDAELAWVAPFDRDAPIRRVTIDLARGGLASASYRPYETQLGFAIDGASRVFPFTTGPEQACAAELLADAGLTLPLSTCAEEGAVGARLGSRVVLLGRDLGGGGIWTASALLDEGSKRRTAAFGPPRETPLPATRREITLGAGVRGDHALAVAVSALGEAALAPIDEATGKLGPEEPLASLTRATLGTDPRCGARSSAPDEARVVLPFTGLIGLVAGSLAGVSEAGSQGVATLRWSASRACIDAIEIDVRDDRYDPEGDAYSPPGLVRKLIVLAPPSSQKARGTLVLIGQGSELRQPLVCDRIEP